MAPRNIPISIPSTGEEEWRAIRQSLTSGWLAQGPKVAAFEEAFALRHGAKHAVASTSATTALHLILASMKIGPGDEVIVPSFTWVSTANAVLFCGATPVLVDILADTFNIDPAGVARKITKKTKAIIAVHLFGLCAEMDELTNVAGTLPIIEDAACAAGSTYKGRSAGSMGLAAAFSFHARKVLTTGEGGMITTNDEGLASRLRSLRTHGADLSENPGPTYLLPDYPSLGFNYRMTDIQAAIGLVQLSKLDDFVAERRKWAAYYSRELSSVPWLKTPQVPDGFGQSWQSYVCSIDEKKAGKPRNRIMAELLERGIHTRPGTHAIHALGFYRSRFGFKESDLPVSLAADRYSMAIPLFNGMTPEDYAYVVEKILEIYHNNSAS